MSWNIAIAVGAALTSLVGVSHMAQEPNFDFGLAIPQAPTNGGLGGGTVSSPGANMAFLQQGLGGGSSQGGQGGQAGQGGQGGGIGGGQGGGGFGGGGGQGGGLGGGQGGGFGGGGGGLGGGMGGFGAVQQDPTDVRMVSVNMRGAKFAEVLRWMQEQGANFVIKDADIRDETVTMNLTKVPLGDALNAIASSMGGYWHRQGSIRVFMKGPSAQVGFGGTSWSTTPALSFPSQTLGTIRPPATPAMPGQFLNGFTWDGSKTFGSASARGGNFYGQRQDWKTFMQTLTKAQKQLNKSRGYLKASDLTDMQRSLLGIQKPTFEMAYGDGKQSIKIKSD